MATQRPKGAPVDPPPVKTWAQIRHPQFRRHGCGPIFEADWEREERQKWAQLCATADTVLPPFASEDRYSVNDLSMEHDVDWQAYANRAVMRWVYHRPRREAWPTLHPPRTPTPALLHGALRHERALLAAQRPKRKRGRPIKPLQTEEADTPQTEETNDDDSPETLERLLGKYANLFHLLHRLDHTELASPHRENRLLATPIRFDMKNDLLPEDVIQIERGTRREPTEGPMEAVFTISFHQRDAALTKVMACRVMANATLQDVRDLFRCPLDTVTPVARAHRHMAYFLIEHCFYYDDRHPDAIHSFQAIEEAYATEFREGLLIKRPMSSTTLSSLSSMRLHKSYLLMHQGHCEHIVVFGDVRFFDPQRSAVSPELGVFSEHAPRRRLCPYCACRAADIVTLNDAPAEQTPAIWCTSCYKAFHYDATTHRLRYGDFEAYRINNSTLIADASLDVPDDPPFPSGRQDIGTLWPLPEEY